MDYFEKAHKWREEVLAGWQKSIDRNAELGRKVKFNEQYCKDLIDLVQHANNAMDTASQLIKLLQSNGTIERDTYIAGHLSALIQAYNTEYRNLYTKYKKEKEE
jgi:CTP-dependent riboflavin kinase